MSSSKNLCLVAAVSKNMGIGVEGRIPWHLKKDMEFFKNITQETRDENKSNMVVMGKKTWLSIPAKYRPLAGRVNVILSTQMTQAPDGALLARSLDDAIKMADADDKIESVFVIGGGAVYKEAMDRVKPCRIYLTRVLCDFNCDVFFPELNLDVFKKVPNPDNVPQEEYEEKGVKFVFEVYDEQK